LSKPRIAVLMDWYLPGTKAGGPVRSVYSLVSLLKDHFDFYILTTNADLGSTSAYKDIEPNTLIYKEGVHYCYFSNDKLNTAEILKVLKLIEPSLVYLNSFWSFRFSINIVRLKKKKQIEAPVLLAPRGMLGKGALGLKSAKKNLFLVLAKLSGWYNNISFHATQAQEELDIRKKFISARILVAPNINSGSVMENDSLKTPNRLKLFYLSRISRVKNLHTALEILKHIPANFTIEYDLFGNIEDVAYWDDCKRIIESLPANVSVNYRNEVQFNEVQKTIRNYHCLFLPTLNENFGHSIVESLLSGCPVIISDQTPWNDVERYQAGNAVPLNDAQAFVNAIKRFAAMDQDEFSAASKRAIKYISDKIDLTVTTEQYKKLFNDCIKDRSVNL
jgi:glycosyltransferase involved in cell wall biosynthesis